MGGARVYSISCFWANKTRKYTVDSVPEVRSSGFIQNFATVYSRVSPHFAWKRNESEHERSEIARKKG